MIETQLKKIKFILDEIQVAFSLTEKADDPFLARVIARHVLIRTKDFIAHTRRMRRPLIRAGHDIKNFHNLKERYTDEFEEYFSEVRNRLGAHVQDLDFRYRIELWRDIEISKVEYFAEGAIEIYSLRL